MSSNVCDVILTSIVIDLFYSFFYFQGKLEMWVDILTTTEAKKRPIIDIRPPPPSPFEVRIVIWGCSDVTIKDTVSCKSLYKFVLNKKRVVILSDQHTIFM